MLGRVSWGISRTNSSPRDHHISSTSSYGATLPRSIHSLTRSLSSFTRGFRSRRIPCTSIHQCLSHHPPWCLSLWIGSLFRSRWMVSFHSGGPFWTIPYRRINHRCSYWNGGFSRRLTRYWTVFLSSTLWSSWGRLSPSLWWARRCAASLWSWCRRSPWVGRIYACGGLRRSPWRRGN